MMTKRAIVLAAGFGSRLSPSSGVPKPLTKVAGKALLVRVLGQLQRAGIREAVLVLGHCGDAIEAALAAEPSLVLRRTYVRNEAYDKQNGVSVLAAREYVDRPCLLVMADHLVSSDLPRRVAEMRTPDGACLLGVDHDVERCFDIDDATKVQVEGTKIVAIGKTLTKYNAIDTGVFRIGPALIESLDRVYKRNGDCSLSDGVSELAGDGRMLACDVGDARWIDVDTPEAHQRAEAMIHVFGDSLGEEPFGAGSTDPSAIDLFAPSWVRAARPYNEDHFAVADRRGSQRMMSNESAFAPSERVIEAIVKAARQAHQYPNSDQALRDRIAARESLAPSNVMIGGGSSELIDLVIRTFVGPGEEAVLSVPTFSLYEARTRVVGGVPILIPNGEDGQVDVAAMVRAITERTKVLFVCSPNNPTGTTISEAVLRRILRLGLPTVVDEAYVEYSSEGTLRHVLPEFPNAIFLRTFSKAFGLAGLRVGYALAHAEPLRLLRQVKVPWSVSSLHIAAACAVLDEVGEQERRVVEVREGRTYLEHTASRIPGIRVATGEANFVLLDVSGTGRSSQELVDELLVRGYFVRCLASHHADVGLLRITVGTKTQNRGCMMELGKILSARPSAPITSVG